MNSEILEQNSEIARQSVEVPASTAWPLILAFGITLAWAGLITSAGVSVLGALLTVTAAVGWFREVLPQERHEYVVRDLDVPPVKTLRPTIDRTTVAPDRHRVWLPVEIYPISAGLKGGLAGSAAMAALAMLYGLISQGSVWYPINLLAAAFFPMAGTQALADLRGFYLPLFLLASALHLVTSILVGLLYGAMLPMLPRRPVLLGGLVAPIVWSGVVHSILGLVNPILEQHIDWVWFVISQMGFGLVAGLVVARQVRIPTWQQLPFAMRAGLERSGMRDQGEEGGQQ